MHQKNLKWDKVKKTKCFETLAQSSFANTSPLGLVGELLETKTKIISPSVSKSGQLLTNSKLKSRVQVQADPVFIKIGFSDQPAGQKLLVIY